MANNSWSNVFTGVLTDLAQGRESSLRHVSVFPERSAQYASWPGWVPSAIVTQLQASGIAQPWTHQVAAASLSHNGHHVVLASGTSSGKSLAYLLSSLSAIDTARGSRGQRGATALYLAPTKALAHDQAVRLRTLAIPELRFATHDGDSSPEQREWSRDHAEYLLTNPDMLHHSLLPKHERWASFFKRLRFVVIDELHHYRGLFGAHVSHVVRRLRRICAHYGSSPRFVLTSATLADPALTASRLIGESVTEVEDDGSPCGRRLLAFWDPQASPSSEISDLFQMLVRRNIRTLTFAGSRRASETIAMDTRQRLAGHPAESRIGSYRGGYLPEERRALEQALREGELIGMVATQALELGIDVSGLDAVLLSGFPGTRSAFWQQVGRAGRGSGDAMAILVARQDQLDHYLLEHPEFLLEQPLEAFVFDPSNPTVLGPHLCAAAAEVPLTDAGPLSPDIFGPTAREAVDALATAGLLRRRPRGWFWTQHYRASDLADLRSSGSGTVSLVEKGTGRIIGTVEAHAAPATAHDGAVYLHQGESWIVRELDLEELVAEVECRDPGYSTFARSTSSVTILETYETTALGAADLFFGSIEVTTQVLSYLSKANESGRVLAETPLELPAHVHRTDAVWWTLSEKIIDANADALGELAGAAHAAEHGAIGLLPLVAICDRGDIGGVSTVMHPQTTQLTVFIYDGRADGVGITRCGFDHANRWLTMTRDRLLFCRCDMGCPACVQSPKCGNQNRPLDKAGAIAMLDLLLS